MLSSKQESLPSEDKYPGSWIFSYSTIKWIFEPSLQKQLPFLYQVFSIYSWLYFRFTGYNYLFGGRGFFLWISHISKKFLGDNYLQLKLPNYEVCLDLEDPRFLQVVNEIQGDFDTQILSDLLSQGDTFIDVGANHGSFSIVASKLLGRNGLIIAIEPQPRLATAIEISLNANANCNFKVYQLAIGDVDGEIDLLIPNGTSGSAGIYQEHSAKSEYSQIKVPLRRFDRLVNWQDFPGKTFLKLDVEGSEFAFLSGAKKAIDFLKPTLIIEVHPGTLKASKTKGEYLKSLLQDLGYNLYSDIENLSLKLPLENLNTNTQRNIVLSMDN